MKHRLLRVNELLKRELSSIITREISFEGALVTLNQVDVTPDLKQAHAYISVFGKENQAGAMAKLEDQRVVLQHALAKAVTLKYTPQLVFHSTIPSNAARGFSKSSRRLRRRRNNEAIELRGNRRAS